MRLFPFAALVALIATTGCSPLTYQPRVVQVQQLPSHPLRASSTYVVVVPPASVGAAQLTDGITIPGLTKASTPDTAEVTINASVGQATVTDLTVATSTREAIISSSSGPTEYQVYSYTGNISIPSQLTITSKKYGQIMSYTQPTTNTLTFDRDPGTKERFRDTVSLEAAFRSQRPALLEKASLSEVESVQRMANRMLIDNFTASTQPFRVQLATESSTDPRFAQAATAFDQAVVGNTTDAAAYATRLKPAMDLWQQIIASPVGDSDDKKNEATGAALYNQAIGSFLLDHVDDAERSLLAAKGLGVDSIRVRHLTSEIADRRKRQTAQGTTP